ncbi:universal stress protein [Natronosalvus rutilus]|uniref:Universal stress protein n=1 Tax=Natronosalvus rutilus TaxID=2953753 RepID=A0A9E7NCG7_9EURY|nr:universal stress protein [Natronosalvus rutilus]UTF54816.1 universal stress protein [Natronosalvus rutilus]
MAIIAAVDKSERAANVLHEANALAKAFDDVIHVVHVLTRSEFVNLEKTNVDDTGIALSMDEVREVAAEIADEVATSVLDSSYEAVGLMGDPAVRVVEYASEQEARYLVVAGRKRSPAGKAVFGSVAQSILLNADCPVVTTIQ